MLTLLANRLSSVSSPITLYSHYYRYHTDQRHAFLPTVLNFSSISLLALLCNSPYRKSDNFFHIEAWITKHAASKHCSPNTPAHLKKSVIPSPLRLLRAPSVIHWTHFGHLCTSTRLSKKPKTHWAVLVHSMEPGRWYDIYLLASLT